MAVPATCDTSSERTRSLDAAAVEVSLRLEAEDRLHRSAYLALREITCVAADGATLLLRGRLPTHHLKQVAQALVDDIEGVGRVINQIVVAAAGRPSTRWDEPRHEVA